MTLDRLIITDFKNYALAEAEFCGNVNCFVGNNGAGKTNLLDAIHYLSFCKSYFNPIDTQNIRIGADAFALHGTYGEGQVSCIVRRNGGKVMKWNRKAYKTLSEHIGKIPLVMVTPTDQNLITGGSELRRKFVDLVISQTDQLYLSHLIDYNKALDQRNRLLKQMWDDRKWDENMLELWDEQLCRHGEYLYETRQEFVVAFGKLFADYYHIIAGDNEPGHIGYLRNTAPIAQQLQTSHTEDRYALHTTHGPHKDDVQLDLMEGMSVKRYGSQGQQKSFSLALKLAQFQYLYNHKGEKPILLLDDIFDKLDMLRVKQLIGLVGSDRFGQVFLTDTQPGRVEALFAELSHMDHCIFNIDKGEVKI
ncbi:MAG: DNA replication and repair protein RecF [Bacteroidales bacterium]|nr:DNA replication and repair protein RecF [Bacteroidales bacterium]